MDLGLRGKAALVAAASKGMGRATAAVLAREGCKVAICARGKGPLEEAARSIRKETGGDVTAIVADLASLDGVRAFVEGATAALGGIDVVVANAGGPPPGGFQSVTEEQWAENWDLTFQSTVRLVRACLPSMKARGGGSVVTILSRSVREPLPNLVLSNALRVAVVGALKTLATEVAKDRIRVNGVCPGWIGTDRTIELHADRAKREGRPAEEVQAATLKDIPMGRFGTPEEVANVIAFLASERASFVTGTFIEVDGGQFRGLF